MKKTILTAWLVAIVATCAQAQYYQSMYSDNSTCNNGMITRTTNAGHVMGGVDRIGLTSDVGLMVIRTDEDGGFTTPDHFNKTYMLTTVAGHILRFNCGHVLEFADGTGYGVMGSYLYDDPASPTGVVHGLAYIRLNRQGVPMMIAGYVPGISPTYILDLMATYEMTSVPGNIVATAHFASLGENSYVIAMRIDQNGLLIWGNTYDFVTPPRVNFEKPEDIIESPYGNQEILVVGSIWYPGDIINPDNENAFCLRLDPASGGVLNLQDYEAGGMELFSAINISNDPLATGFIICGYTDDYHAGIGWVVKMDQNLTIQWSQMYQENRPSVEEIKPYEIVGRLNTLGDYEYYVTGRIEQTYMDAFIMKLDAGGVPVNPGALFVYETGANFAHWGNSVDVNTSGMADGVSMYGQWEDPLGSPVYRRTYVVKAYFNGQSGCNESFRNINNNNVSVLQRSYGVNTKAISDYPLLMLSITLNNDLNLCYSKTLPGGDNTFTTSMDELSSGISGMSVFPNPFHTGDKNITLKLQSSAAEMATVNIIDVLGRTVYSNNYALNKGENTIQAELGNLEIGKGIYQVIVHKASGNEVVKLIIQ